MSKKKKVNLGSVPPAGNYIYTQVSNLEQRIYRLEEAIRIIKNATLEINKS